MSDPEVLRRRIMETPRSRIQLTHLVIVKAPGLLPMLYKPAELAEDLNLPVRTLYDWLKAGAPHTRDKRDRLWINGQEFAMWVGMNRKPQGKHVKLTDDQAYCLRCHAAVRLVEPRQQHVKGKLFLIKGKCPHCGASINRGGRHDR
jgi:hypothetical protein